LQPSNILLVGKVSPFEKNFTFGPRFTKILSPCTNKPLIPLKVEKKKRIWAFDFSTMK
jgi:hypothetical protein